MPRARRNYTQVSDYLAEHDLLGRCQICGRTDDLQYAHLWGRTYDDRGGQVHPLDVIIMGGPFGCNCHGRYDRHELNILPHISPAHIQRGIEVLGRAKAAWRLTGDRLADLP
jgi:hypothetical protein